MKYEFLMTAFLNTGKNDVISEKRSTDGQLEKKEVLELLDRLYVDRVSRLELPYWPKATLLVTSKAPAVQRKFHRDARINAVGLGGTWTEEPFEEGGEIAPWPEKKAEKLPPAERETQRQETLRTRDRIDYARKYGLSGQ